MTMAYVGRKKCGCVTCIVVDDPNDVDFTAKTLGEYVMEGKTIEHVSVDEGVKMLKKCTCGKESK